ncbi:hypothetical protein VTO73DRAFT_9163 [Trametes versicolor]
MVPSNKKKTSSTSTNAAGGKATTVSVPAVPIFPPLSCKAVLNTRTAAKRGTEKRATSEFRTRSGLLVSRTGLYNSTHMLADPCIGAISQNRDKTSSAHVILARYRPSQSTSVRTEVRAREVVSDRPSAL